MALAKQKGAKMVKALPVSAPFHSALMAPAAEKLRVELERVKMAPLAVPVVANVTAEPNRDAARVKELLFAQVTGSVRWEETCTSWCRWASTRRTRSGRARCSRAS